MKKLTGFTDILLTIIVFVTIFRSYFWLSDLLFYQHRFLNLSFLNDDQLGFVILLIYIAIVFPCTLLLIKWLLNRLK